MTKKTKSVKKDLPEHPPTPMADGDLIKIFNTESPYDKAMLKITDAMIGVVKPLADKARAEQIRALAGALAGLNDCNEDELAAGVRQELQHLLAPPVLEQ